VCFFHVCFAKVSLLISESLAELGGAMKYFTAIFKYTYC